MEKDYKVFIVSYDDCIIDERYKSSVELTGWDYFNTFKEAKNSLVHYYKNMIEDAKQGLKKAKSLKQFNL